MTTNQELTQLDKIRRLKTCLNAAGRTRNTLNKFIEVLHDQQDPLEHDLRGFAFNIGKILYCDSGEAGFKVFVRTLINNYYA